MMSLFRLLPRRITLWSLFTVVILILVMYNFSHVPKPAMSATNRIFAVDKRDLEQLNVQLNSAQEPTVIQIVIIVCSAENNTNSLDEAIVLIKSVILSAIWYKTENISFQIFLEHMHHIHAFWAKLIEFGYPFKNLQISANFHSVFHAVPEEHHETLLFFKDFRCMYVRMFLPSALPTTDAVIYLDTDFIITGNVAEFWKLFGEMKGEKLIGVSADSEPESPHYSLWFYDIPFPPPKGLNSGLLLMNLTSMRRYNWTERVLRLFHDHSSLSYMNDQKLINLITYYDSGILYRVPCQFNFRDLHCNYVLHCQSAENDTFGIQGVHGASSMFSEGRIFRRIYDRYKNVLYKMIKNINFLDASKSFISELMAPVRHDYRYRPTPRTTTTRNAFRTKVARWNFTSAVYVRKCDGILNKLLFKNFFP